MQCECESEQQNFLHIPAHVFYYLVVVFLFFRVQVDVLSWKLGLILQSCSSKIYSLKETSYNCENLVERKERLSGAT